MKITVENLSYLTAHELWEILAAERVPYFTVEEIEKEDPSTHTMVKVPKITPRTDFEDMKDEIVLNWDNLNRKKKREIESKYGKLIEKRKKVKRNE